VHVHHDLHRRHRRTTGAGLHRAAARPLRAAVAVTLSDRRVHAGARQRSMVRGYGRGLAAHCTLFVRSILDRRDADALGSRLHRARDATRSKSSPKAVRGSRKAEGEKSAETVDERVAGSVNSVPRKVHGAAGLSGDLSTEVLREPPRDRPRSTHKRVGCVKSTRLEIAARSFLRPDYLARAPLVI
jgi:hypothetical protein